MSLEFGNDREACNVVVSGLQISSQPSTGTALLLAVRGVTSVSRGIIVSTLFTSIDNEYKKCF